MLTPTRLVSSKWGTQNWLELKEVRLGGLGRVWGWAIVSITLIDYILLAILLLLQSKLMNVLFWYSCLICELCLNCRNFKNFIPSNHNIQYTSLILCLIQYSKKKNQGVWGWPLLSWAILVGGAAGLALNQSVTFMKTLVLIVTIYW